MEVWEINEVFETRLEAIEFYKELYTQISKFRSLTFELVLKWGDTYSVKGFIRVVSSSQKDAIDNILERLDA